MTFDLDDLDLSKNEPLKLISGAALHLPSKFGEDQPRVKALGGVGEQTNKQTNKQTDKRCSNYSMILVTGDSISKFTMKINIGSLFSSLVALWREIFCLSVFWSMPTHVFAVGLYTISQVNVYRTIGPPVLECSGRKVQMSQLGQNVFLCDTVMFCSLVTTSAIGKTVQMTMSKCIRLNQSDGYCHLIS